VERSSRLDVERLVGGLRQQRMREAQRLAVLLQDTGISGSGERVGAIGSRAGHQPHRGPSERGYGGQRLAGRRIERVHALLREAAGVTPGRDFQLGVATEPSGQLERVERIAAGRSLKLLELWPPEREAEVLAGQLVDSVEIERADVQLGGRTVEGRDDLGQRRGDSGRADRGDDRAPTLTDPADGVGEHLGRGVVEPREIVDRDHQRSRLGEGAEHADGAHGHRQGRRRGLAGGSPLERDVEGVALCRR
jgi:hypothetical protein